MRLLSQAAFFSLLWPALCSATQSVDPQRALVLYSDERLLPANVIFDRSFRTNLQADTSRHVEFHSEFLDVARFSREAQQENQRDFLRAKYRDYPPDLTIAVSASAVAFLMKYRATLFTEVPVVYLTWQGEAPPGDLGDPKAAGISIPGSVDATLRLALDLQQDTRRIAIVTGSSQRDKTLAEEARKGSSTFENRVAFTWLTDLSLPELRDQLARLPDHTVVLYLTLFLDAAGNRFTPQEALDQFAPASRVPIYGYYDTYLGHGIVGGSFVTFEEIGRKAAQASLRILSGESPQDVARSEIGQSIPMFDWRELRRWNISERRVPPGGVMLFREATYWEKNHWLILGVVAASLIEGLLIAVLFVQLRRRRQVEAFLRESEQQMGLAASAAELAMWTWDIVRNQIWMSDKGRALFGIAPDTRLDSAALSAHVHPDDRAARDAVIRRALETQGEYAMEYRVVLDGQVRWIAGRGRVEFAGGKPVLMRGISLDITERRQAELEVARQRNELAHRSRVMLLGELSGSLAHELNQPLGAIVTNAGAALRCLARDSMTRAMFREVLEDIVAAGRRGGEIIRGIKGMLRKAEGARQLVDLNDVIAQTLRLTQSDALANDCAVLTEFYPALPKVEADVVQLQQVFLNLILNAFEASKDVPKLQRRVIIHTERDGDGTVRACVRDFGAGLPAEASEQVFEQFFSTKRDGMGMGLFISRSIVAAHRGTLCAENAAGGGAQFWLRLPASKESNL